jgi:DNA-binding LacI/PurR family transcriptional regulator
MARLEQAGLITRRGSRTRIVADRAAPSAAGLMSGTLMLVFDPQTPFDGTTASGWEAWIGWGALAEAARRGVGVLSMRPAEARVRLEDIRRAPPSGIIVARSNTPWDDCAEWCDNLRRAGAAIVRIDDAPPEDDPSDTVGSDQELGARKLTQYLISRGRRRLLRYRTTAPGQTPPRWLQARDRGTDQACIEAGLPIAPIVPAPWVVIEGDVAQRVEAESLMIASLIAPAMSDPATRPDAILCDSDGMTFGVLRALRRLGLRPNVDVDVVGYDNYFAQTLENEVEPLRPLATVDKRNAEVGAEAVTILLDRIAGTLPADPVRRWLAPRLVVSPQ